MYLSLCEVQVDGDLVAAQPGQVVMVGELSLQLSQLLLGKRCALFPGLAAGVHLKTGLLDIWRETEKEMHFVLVGLSAHPICLKLLLSRMVPVKWKIFLPYFL